MRPPQPKDLDGRDRMDRRVTWRSVTAGFVLIAGVFAVMVAVSHPTATAVVLATGAGGYALRRLVRQSTVDRTLQLCGPRFCLQFRLRLG